MLLKALLLAFTLASPQIVTKTSQRTKPGEQTPQAVARQVHSTLKKLGQEPGSLAKIQLTLVDFGSLRSWNCETEGRAFVALVDPANLKVSSLVNQARERARHKKQGRTGKVFFKKEAELNAKMRSILKGLSLPGDISFQEFEVIRDGGGEGADWAGRASAVFVSAKGKALGAISIDVQDGALLFFSEY